MPFRRFGKLVLSAVTVWLGTTLPDCVGTETQLQSPEQALRECHASNPYSEEQEYQQHMEYARACYFKYNEAKGKTQ